MGIHPEVYFSHAGNRGRKTYGSEELGARGARGLLLVREWKA
eukprot:CAMPEP_0184329814 /NCGR_PEP_ID=MMETSP1049-20130417/144347_1 /TAXON_ID=77928 /ORGANISM="Proteomonas sulcata, Strain CCMP704" /LENGTH=41 /DNA_ID= /DNA_START= /DNA_END= /DNA_ORIENTATION=